MADDIIYINAEEGAKRVMSNAKLYTRLLVKFKDDPSFNSLDSAVTEGDTERAKVMSHTLKGLAANLSLTELYKQSLELETQIKNGVINQEQFALLKNVYNKTLDEIEKVITQNA